MSADQQDWMDYVSLMGFNYNITIYLATKQLPFKLAYGMEPLQLIDLALKGTH